VLLVPEVCRVDTETTIDMSHGYTDTYGMLDGMRVLQILVPAWLICASPNIHAENREAAWARQRIARSSDDRFHHVTECWLL
jgi:hypothetical protein